MEPGVAVNTACSHQPPTPGLPLLSNRRMIWASMYCVGFGAGGPHPQLQQQNDDGSHQSGPTPGIKWIQ